MERGSAELKTGLYTFNENLKEFSKNNELWICYATPRKISKAQDINKDQVEIAVTVLTTPEAPMTTHMGISRSFKYLLNASEEMHLRQILNDASDEDLKKYNFQRPTSQINYPLHRNLAMQIHSFAAKVMKLRDPKKIYMINSPTPPMRTIMKKALPNKTFVGDNVSMAKEIVDQSSSLSRSDRRKEIAKVANEIKFNKESSPIRKTLNPGADNLLPEVLQIYNKNRNQVVFEYRKKDNNQEAVIIGKEKFTGPDVKRFNWFLYGHMNLQPYATVDLEALAAYSPLKKIEITEEDILAEELERKVKTDREANKTKHDVSKFLTSEEDHILYEALANGPSYGRDSFDEVLTETLNSGYSDNGEKWIKIALKLRKDHFIKKIHDSFPNIDYQHLDLSKDEWTTLLKSLCFPAYGNELKIIIQKGADVNTKIEGETPLHKMTKTNFDESIEMVNFLLKNKADPNILNNSKESPLFEAVRSGSWKNIELLVAGGSDINHQNEWGDTPLHIAVSRVPPSLKVINTLLNYGANPTLKNNKEKIPYDLTINEEVKKVLEKAEKEFE